MLTCYLCEEETVLIARFCENCRVVKRIMNIYGAEECKRILESVCIRNGEQRQRKINYEKKKAIEGKVYGDDSKEYDNKK